MDKEFLVIAITLPDFFPEEAKKIENILRENKAKYVHIRKPYATEKEIASLIENISPDFYSRVKLHDSHPLAIKYGLGGIHFNSRTKEEIKYQGEKSISIHSLEEIQKTKGFDYFFLSPIFDSISKEGYRPKFKLEELGKYIKGKNAIALGGVTPDKFEILKASGFHGAAMLGYFWK